MNTLVDALEKFCYLKLYGYIRVSFNERIVNHLQQALCNTLHAKIGIQ